MYVVPNHLLEQFAREFMQLYPNAKLLVAGKEDFTRERRKFLTAKIASGEWDGIVVTHSSFERIGMSRDYQEQFLKEQIAEYDQLLCDGASKNATRAHRNLIKTIEKQKAKREERLKDLLAEDKKDDGLVFDELGVDHIFIDEAHYFKNLETPTKMDRVAGIQTGGSERAFDLYMKARYLHQLHPGHGVTFATGTPISNTMVEMYTMQRFLDPEGLKSRGIDHFDAWAATFGEVVDTMEISPDGASLKPRSRFARFTNLPELQQMFRAFADVQTAEMLDLPRPRAGNRQAHCRRLPDVRGAARHPAGAGRPLRPAAQRRRSIRGRTTPWPSPPTAASSPSTPGCCPATAPDFPGSKVNALVDNVVAVWRRTEATRGTQMIFCDMGVHPTPWGYSAYDEVIEKLVQRGIPRQQIATIGDADSDAKKLALFEKVRSGSVRVLIGSTQKMGTGTNVQKRLVALHHLDAPWKPAEVEQRDGRILRQNNENKQVAIYRYVTEGSFDAYMWQALETKARFISQVMTGDNAAPPRRGHRRPGAFLRRGQGDRIRQPGGADAGRGRRRAATAEPPEEEPRRRAVPRPPQPTRAARRPSSSCRNACPTSRPTWKPPRLMPTTPSPSATAASTARTRSTSLALAWTPCRNTSSRAARVPLGVYRGLRFGLTLDPQFAPEVYLEGAITRRSPLSREHHGPRAVLNALERLAGGYGSECSRVQEDLGIAESQLRDYQARLGAPFPHDAYLAELTGLRDQLKAGLSGCAAGARRRRAADRCRTRRTDQGAQGRAHHRGRTATHGKTPCVRRGAGHGADTPARAGGRGRMAAAGERARGEEGGQGVENDGQSGVPALTRDDDP